MKELFGSIYCWLEDFFGNELAEYLWGNASPYSESCKFISIGISMIIISLLMVILYYYVVNHPRLSNWKCWGIALLINGIINFIVGWQMVLSDYYNDKMVRIDPSTDLEVPLNVGSSEFICFGISNMILALIAFFIFSLILKWRSSNCSHSPF